MSQVELWVFSHMFPYGKSGQPDCLDDAIFILSPPYPPPLSVDEPPTLLPKIGGGGGNDNEQLNGEIPLLLSVGSLQRQF